MLAAVRRITSSVQPNSPSPCTHYTLVGVLPSTSMCSRPSPCFSSVLAFEACSLTNARLIMRAHITPIFRSPKVDIHPRVDTWYPLSHRSLAIVAGVLSPQALSSLLTRRAASPQGAPLSARSMCSHRSHRACLPAQICRTQSCCAEYEEQRDRHNTVRLRGCATGSLRASHVSDGRDDFVQMTALHTAVTLSGCAFAVRSCLNHSIATTLAPP